MRVTLTRDQFEELELLANDLGVTVDDAYSGRGMYGRSCVALVADGGAADLVRFVVAVTREGDVSESLDEFADRLPDVRTDQLGLGSVFYWPSVDVAAVTS